MMINGLPEEQVAQYVNSLNIPKYLNRYNTVEKQMIDAAAEYITMHPDPEKAYFLITALPIGHPFLDQIVMIAIENEEAAKQIVNRLRNSINQLRLTNIKPQQLINKIVEMYPSMYERVLFNSRDMHSDKEFKNAILARVRDAGVDMRDRVDLALSAIGISGYNSHELKTMFNSKTKAYAELFNFAFDNFYPTHYNDIVDSGKIKWTQELLQRFVDRLFQIDEDGTLLGDIVSWQHKINIEIPEDMRKACLNRALDLEIEKGKPKQSEGYSWSSMTLAERILRQTKEYTGFNDRKVGTKEWDPEIYRKVILACLKSGRCIYDVVRRITAGNEFTMEDFNSLPQEYQKLIKEKTVKLLKNNGDYNFQRAFRAKPTNHMQKAIEKGIITPEDGELWNECLMNAFKGYFSQIDLMSFMERYGELAPREDYKRIINGLFVNRTLDI